MGVLMAGDKGFEDPRLAVGELVALKDHRPPIKLCNYYKRF